MTGEQNISVQAISRWRAKSLTLGVRPQMKKMTHITVLAACLLAVGCSRPVRTDPAVMVIHPGVGVSNVVAIGMTVADMHRASPDLEHEREPTRFPWEKPNWHGGRIPSIGAQFSGSYTGQGKPYQGFINFHIVAPSNEPSFQFQGSLAPGLSFADGQTVRRPEVVDTFGSPEKTIDQSQATNMIPYMMAGIDFAMLCPTKDGSRTELLYYPTQGVMFDLKNDTVTRVAVFPKQGGRTSP
jgi:hypothetical protein